MASLARLAVGTTPQGASATAMLWALDALLCRRGIGVQNFLSRAALICPHGGAAASARPRHLDSWLMDSATCREVFAHGTPPGSLGLVEGVFDSPFEPDPRLRRDGREIPLGEAYLAPGGATCYCSAAAANRGGQLETLCEWLDLPRIVVLDASRLDSCRQPQFPPATDGLLLDCVASAGEAVELSTRLGALWGLPILGSLERLPQLRRAVDDLPPGSAPPEELKSALAANLQQSVRLDDLLRLAQRRPWIDVQPRLFREEEPAESACIAVAHDEAFRGYFQETLDVLELRGARIEVFSPLRDESLPLGTDVVYIGCGHPEQFAAALAENSCLMLALRQHLCNGQRIYGEGGGMAYLCRQIELPDGSRHEMVGALPAIAQLNGRYSPPEPVEITLARGNWLGEGWSRLRGYRSTRWEIVPTGPLVSYALEPRHALDLVGRHQAIGSRIHLNFATQLDYLNSFFEPHAAAMDAAVP